MRTTIDLDDSVLDELRRRQRREGKSLGTLASELLAAALHEEPAPVEPLRWHSREMGTRVDLEDDEALRRVLETGS